MYLSLAVAGSRVGDCVGFGGRGNGGRSKASEGGSAALLSIFRRRLP